MPLLVVDASVRQMMNYQGILIGEVQDTRPTIDSEAEESGPEVEVEVPVYINE